MTRQRTAPDLAAARAAEERLARLLAVHPELRDRTAAMLAGALPCPDLQEQPTMTNSATADTRPITIRLPIAMFERADALVPVIGAAPEFATLIRVTRSDALRLAILIGMAELERQYGQEATLPVE